MRQTGKPMGLNCRLERDIDVGRHPIGETAEDNNGAIRNLGGDQLAMKAFEFDHRLVDSYARLSRFFSIIRSEDLKAEICRQYDVVRFLSDTLLSMDPRFLHGPTVDEWVRAGGHRGKP